MNDDSLWNADSSRDPELDRVERALAKHRRPARPLIDLATLEAHRPRPKRSLSLGRSLLAAGMLLGATVLLRTANTPSTSDGPRSGATPYSLETIEGAVAVSVDDRELRTSNTRLPPGSVITSGKDGRARLRVDRVGSMILEQDSRMRIDDSIAHDDSSGYFVHLDKGSLRATIFAAPRLFQIGTPGGIAVDLGCIYRATVRTDGSTLLTVESGAVSFEALDHKVYVPRDAEAVAKPGRGPGTPVWSDSPSEYKSDVEALDAATEPSQDLLARVLAPNESRATLTYAHLLTHASASVRTAALDRVIAIEKKALELDRDALLRGDRRETQRLIDLFRNDWRW